MTTSTQPERIRAEARRLREAAEDAQQEGDFASADKLRRASDAMLKAPKPEPTLADRVAALTGRIVTIGDHIGHAEDFGCSPEEAEQYAAAPEEIEELLTGPGPRDELTAQGDA
jgi:hypothetical protein